METLTLVTDKFVGIAGFLYIAAMVLYTFYLIFKNKTRLRFYKK